MKKKLVFPLLVASLFVLTMPNFSYAEEEVAEESAVDEEESFDDSDDFSEEDDSFGDEAEAQNTAEESPAAEAVAEPTPTPEPVVAEPAAPAEEMKEADSDELEELVEDKPQEEAPSAPQEPLLPEEPTETKTEYASTPVSDDPDLNYEAYLHDIFLNFYNTKTPEDQWSSLAGARGSERYKIQRGDNLWSISKTLFGDGHYWPKVWSLNSGITNPHIISPNNSIRFLLGDESEPPAFTVTENSTETEGKGAMVQPEKTEEQQATVVDGEALSEDEPEIPPPLRQSRPVVKKLPPSLPAWQDASAMGDYDDTGISYVRRKILDIEDTMQLPSFIAEQPPESLGTVKEVEVGHNIASAFQYIYVSMKPGQGQVGQIYLAVADRGLIQSVHPSITGFLGYSIDVQGEVQLVEKVESSDPKESGELFRALVLKIVNPVGVGSTLVDSKIERVQITEQGPRSQVVAQIIGGSYFNRRQVYGSESVAYINRGEQDGLREGHVLPIRANTSIRNESTVVRTNIRPIGWARVLKTTPRFATVLIVRAWSDVLTGDVTGSGELLPQGLGQTADVQEGGASTAEMDSEFDDGEDVTPSNPENEPSSPPGDDDSFDDDSFDEGGDFNSEDDSDFQ